MLDTVRTFIQKEELLSKEATVIVGLSGGMDSMALLDILTLLGYRCVAAHCNFHLRGEESNNDADFVKRWCKDVGIPLVTIDFDTNEYAFDRKISIEMAARELRYNWFEIMRKEHQAEAIAVAHHRDDLVETVLLNLVRGTGIKGLRGIAPKNRKVIRPLLSVSRDELAQYMAERDIPYVFDSSNNDDYFLRNALRLNVIPLLEKLNPAVKDAIFRTAHNLAQVENVYNAAIRESLENIVQNDKIDVKALCKTPSPQSILFELLTPLDFTPSTIIDISESIDAEPGKIFLSQSHRVIKDRDYFIIDRLSNNETFEESILIDSQEKELTSPLPLTFSILTMPVTIERNKRYLYADLDLLTFPLTLRKWRKGDWFIPFGMKGRKKLSDYFTNQKFSLKDKEEVWILLSGEDIVWIVGERPDERYRITKDTLRVFHGVLEEDS
jgi:tRNA(Ile)-lysidine synthase